MQSDLRRDAGPGVADPDHRFARLALQQQGDVFLIGIIHRVQRVAQQVDQHLLGPHRIADHLGRVADIDLQRGAMGLELVVQQQCRRLYRF